MRRARYLAAPLLGLWACAPAQTPSPVPAPLPMVAVGAVEPTPLADPAPAQPEQQRDVARALTLLEEGRTMQRERGEGGAADAIARYTDAIAADPLCAACFWELGWSYQVTGRWAECVTAWDEVRKIDARFPELDVHAPVARMRAEQAAYLASLPDPAASPPPELEPRAGPSLTVRAVGDVQLGMAWPEDRAKLPPNDARDMFDTVRPLLAGGDIVFGNLETALADAGDSTKCGPKSTKCFAFRAPTRFAHALRDAGFSVLSIANNHAGDFGEPGRRATIKALDEAAIKHSGPIGDLATLEVGGLRVGLVAFSTGAGVYRVQEIDLARRIVADLARRHDIVVVSFHGGAEGLSAMHVPQGAEVFFGEDRGDLRAFTHAVVDAGADLVLGHGPHVLRALEIYKERLIAYSLGNFCTWETFNLKEALGVSGILSVQLAPNGVVLGIQLTPVAIEKPGRPRPDPARRAIEHVRALSRADFGDAVLGADGTWTRPVTVAQTR